MARVNWIISGSLKIGNIPSSFRIDNSTTASLGGVTLKIYANEGLKWKLWGTVRTRRDGTFSMTKIKDRTRRKFRIMAQFKNEHMVIYGENKSLFSHMTSAFDTVHSISTRTISDLEGILTHTSKLNYKCDSHKVYETSTRRRLQSSRRYSADIVIRPNINFGMPHRHALIWYGLDRLRVHLKNAGYGFTKRVAIKYPHNNKLIGDKAETAYCSPINNCVYMVRNSRRDNMLDINGNLSLETLFHEVMHLWAYQYSKGEDGMAVQLIATKGDTHRDFQNKPFVAFHEAFAEVSSRIFLSKIFNFTGNIYEHPDFPFVVRPFNREFLRLRGVIGDTVLGFMEFGWIHIFNTLMCRSLLIYDLNQVEDPDNRRSSGSTIYAKEIVKGVDRQFSLTIYDILETFSTPAPITKSEMTYDSFMARVLMAVPEVDTVMLQKFRRIIDPTNTEIPRDIF